MAINLINERSTFYLTVSFKDQNGTAENPAAARYRIDNPKTGQQIRGWTALSPIAGVVTITVNAVDNTLTQTKVLQEKRILTVDSDYGSTPYVDGVKDTYSWEIKSLQYLSSTE
jgi:hypothetical protein